MVPRMSIWVNSGLAYFGNPANNPMVLRIPHGPVTCSAPSCFVYLTMQKARPRFAIVGCGRIAHRHAGEASKIGELIAVCDILPEKADALA